MIDIFVKRGDEIIKEVGVDRILDLQNDQILWVDAYRPSEVEQNIIEKTLDVDLLSKEEAEEIESTSKYSEAPNGVVANMDFYQQKTDRFTPEPISFIISRTGFLVSVRHIKCDVFEEAEKRILLDKSQNFSGTDIFMTLIEAHIDREADMLELVAKHIAQLNHDITSNDRIGKEMIRRINSLQEKIMSLRESIFDCQRVLFSIRRSSRFPASIQPRLLLMLNDVDSLISHADFSLQRLDSLQDTAMGLINIEQNEIVKILSVAAVIFMPPTLVASLYGMNFKVMPELNWEYHTAAGSVIPVGYIFALCLMVIFALLTYFFFKFKKWL